MLYHLAKYAMDVAFVDDKEIHMAIFVDYQFKTCELQDFLKKPVGSKLTFDDNDKEN